MLDGLEKKAYALLVTIERQSSVPICDDSILHVRTPSPLNHRIESIQFNSIFSLVLSFSPIFTRHAVGHVM